MRCPQNYQSERTKVSDSLYNEVTQVYANANLLVPEHDIHKAIDAVAVKVQNDYADKNPIMLCVMNGGMFFSAQLCQRLDFAFQMDYLHATRYTDNCDSDTVVWKAMPQLELANRHVLVLDDILDVGHTLKAVKAALLTQQPASLKVAVLTNKVHNRRIADIAADYIGVDVADRYVFGCGLDYKGYYRNLSAIYCAD